MQKKLLILLLVLFVFFLKSEKVLAVICGDPYSSVQTERRCCDIPPDSLDMSSIASVAIPGVNIQQTAQDLMDSTLKGTMTDADKASRLLNACKAGSVPSKDDVSATDCYCLTDEKLDLDTGLCGKYLSKSGDYKECISCFKDQGGYYSGLGCIYLNDWKTFVEKNIISRAIGLAGGVSLLCIIYAAFMMQTSGGSPEKIKKAQELLTACISGLILIIFSIFILRLIGVDILKIPGLS